MNLENLRPAQGAVHNKKKRLGRGQSSGKGGTCTRGHKGAKSRSGFSIKIGFEGGQMPLQRRIPKYGFSAVRPVNFKCICLADIEEIIEKHKLSGFVLQELEDKQIFRSGQRIKVLAGGKLSQKLTVEAHAFSAAAKSQIEATGGSATLLA